MTPRHAALSLSRPTLNHDRFRAQIHLLLHRHFDDGRANAVGFCTLNLTLADPQLFLRDGDDLFLGRTDLEWRL